MLEFLIFFVSLFFLVKSAEILVNNSSKLASKIGISKVIIGLTLVAFGTSLPEFAVNIISSLKKENGIVLGNIIGSNIANISLILGLVSLISPLKIEKKLIFKEIPLAFLIVIACIALIADNTLNFLDGIVLYTFFIFFLFFITEKVKTDEKKEKIETKESYIKLSFLILISVFGIYISGEFLVKSLIGISKILNISTYNISAVLVAVGTSLPELLVSFVAFSKKERELLVGNLIGSNIFNTSFILATSSIIYPISIVSKKVLTHLSINLMASLLLFIFNFTFKKDSIDRKEGFLLLLTYLLFIFSL